MPILQNSLYVAHKIYSMLDCACPWQRTVISHKILLLETTLEYQDVEDHLANAVLHLVQQNLVGKVNKTVITLNLYKLHTSIYKAVCTMM